MSDAAGQFVWYELMTSDTGAASDFYSKVTGWTTQDSGMPGMEYFMFATNGEPHSGLMQLTPEMQQKGIPPHWLGYVGVASVDDAAAQATSLGGQVMVPPTDIPNMGRFAVLADPHGAAIAVYSNTNPEEAWTNHQNDPGHVGWHELNAGDFDSAWAFYSALFGWELMESMDMGPMGTYHMYGKNGNMLGGMMTKPAEVPVPFWSYYVNVPSIDTAVETIKASGGNLMVEPMEVPGGSFIIIGTDPQGAVFALVGPR